MTSGQLIQEARLRAGLTQAELAERLGRDRAQIARWENEGQQPSFENLRAVVEACGFAMRVEIGPPDSDALVDAELGASLRLAPQQRLEQLLERLRSSS